MQKKYIGNLSMIFLVGLNITGWLLFPPIDDGREHFINQYIGEIFSTSGLILMACNIFLSTRPRFLEPYFGGLDQMYQTHKKSAITAIIFILTHFFIMSLGGAFNLGISLGKIALIGLLVSIILALAPRVPFFGGYLRLRYQDWKFIHKFIGLFFIVGLLHMNRIQNLLQTTPFVYYYVLSISYLGVAVYLYKELIQPLVKRKYPYLVERVRRLSGSVIEISLSPQKRRLRHTAGQFMFIDFDGDKELRESHPFTISSSPKSETIRLAIRASGDFTQRLFEVLDSGAAARIEGSYGMFNYKSAGLKQVWVAGGIGLTPFLSWIRDFDGSTPQTIDFYYALRLPEEALYLDEIEQAQETNPNFRVHMHFSNRDGRLSAEKIVESSGPPADKDIFLCGPFTMTLALKSQFMKMGVRPSSIHYEEFSFR